MAQVPGGGLGGSQHPTTGPPASEEFYREVAGLTTAPGPTFVSAADEESLPEPFGGRAEEPSGHSDGEEPFWMAYIGVQDVDAAAERASRIGGQILLPPTEVPGLGRVAVLQDPRGLTFGIFTPAR